MATPMKSNQPAKPGHAVVSLAQTWLDCARAWLPGLAQASPPPPTRNPVDSDALLADAEGRIWARQLGSDDSQDGRTRELAAQLCLAADLACSAPDVRRRLHELAVMHAATKYPAQPGPESVAALAPSGFIILVLAALRYPHRNGNVTGAMRSALTSHPCTAGDQVLGAAAVALLRRTAADALAAPAPRAAVAACVLARVLHDPRDPESEHFGTMTSWPQPGVAALLSAPHCGLVEHVLNCLADPLDPQPLASRAELQSFLATCKQITQPAPEPAWPNQTIIQTGIQADIPADIRDRIHNHIRRLAADFTAESAASATGTNHPRPMTKDV